MHQPRLFGVYTVNFPFIESSVDKIRPVIVVSKPYGQFNILAIIPIASKSKQESIDVKLEGWKQSGLLKPSFARLHRITTVLKSDLIAELGTLNTADTNSIKTSIKNYLQH